MEGIGSMKDKVLALKIRITTLTDYFYQQKSKEGYLELIGVIDDITIITELLSVRSSDSDLVDINRRLMEALQEAMNAMLQKDTVLIADIMQYEITDILDEIIDMNI
jgi:hypothetical protein